MRRVQEDDVDLRAPLSSASKRAAVMEGIESGKTVSSRPASTTRWRKACPSCGTKPRCGCSSGAYLPMIDGSRRICMDPSQESTHRTSPCALRPPNCRRAPTDETANLDNKVRGATQCALNLSPECLSGARCGIESPSTVRRACQINIWALRAVISRLKSTSRVGYVVIAGMPRFLRTLLI